MLSISRNIRLSVCPSVCLSVCLFTFEVPFNGLFAPTSQSPMQKKFFFLSDFALQNIVETTLPAGLETSGRRAYRLFWHISIDVFEFWHFG